MARDRAFPLALNESEPDPVITDTIILDIDTQWDLVMPDGAWPVPGAFGLNPVFERLTRYARTYDIRVVATCQALASNDPRFGSADGMPPPYCVAGSPGARKIPATRPGKPVVVPARPMGSGELKALIGDAREIVVETGGPDLMSNPGTAEILTWVRGAIVFGVGGEEAVLNAVRALKSKGITVDVVQNAVALRSAEPEARDEWLETVRGLGARIIRDLDVMTRHTTARHH
ncbi:MAG TPA: isochorismatase family protein [Candidatus Eisenbacteria bacterium]